ncbi:hypothetical protein ACWGF3_14385 [Streptomyces xanthophaeus]
MTTSKGYTAWLFKCDCGVVGPVRNTQSKAEQDRQRHMARQHPKWDLSGLFRSR